MERKRYANDYETVITTDEKGREKKIAVYHGDYFEFALDKDGILKFKRNSIFLLIGIVILHLSGGFVDNQGMYQFYVALPYVFAYFPLLYLAAGVLLLPKEKRKYRRDEIGLSFYRMKTSSKVLLLFLGIGVLGEISFILFASVKDQRMLEYLYLALEVVSAAVVYSLISLQKKIQIKPCSKQ